MRTRCHPDQNRPDGDPEGDVEQVLILAGVPTLQHGELYVGARFSIGGSDAREEANQRLKHRPMNRNIGRSRS